EHVAACDFAEQREIAENEVPLGDESQVPAALPGEDLQDRAGGFGAALGGLIGIGGGADGDSFVLVLNAGEFLAKQVAGGRFGVDFGLEVGGVEFHELVGVAGKA